MKVLICILSLLLVLTSDVYAVRSLTDESYFDRTTYKLGRGVCNLFGSGTEILRGLDDAQREYGTHGFCIGFTRGIGKTFVRAGAGIIDIITFPIARSRREEYFLKPELASLEGTAITWKNPLIFN